MDIDILHFDFFMQGEIDAQEGRPVKRYVQEQEVTSLAMVADASEGGFVKV